MGGEHDWTYSYVEPSADENAPMQDTKTRDELVAARDEIVRQYEEATAAWVSGTAEDVAACKKERAELAEKLRENYWKLDPHVRARTLYDRTGEMGKQGELNFYKK